MEHNLTLFQDENVITNQAVEQICVAIKHLNSDTDFKNKIAENYQMEMAMLHRECEGKKKDPYGKGSEIEVSKRKPEDKDEEIISQEIAKQANIDSNFKDSVTVLEVSPQNSEHNKEDMKRQGNERSNIDPNFNDNQSEVIYKRTLEDYEELERQSIDYSKRKCDFKTESPPKRSKRVETEQENNDPDFKAAVPDVTQMEFVVKNNMISQETDQFNTNPESPYIDIVEDECAILKLRLNVMIDDVCQTLKEISVGELKATIGEFGNHFALKQFLIRICD